MPEAEVKEVGIETLSPTEYNKARDAGKTVVEMPVEKPAEKETEKQETAEGAEVKEEKPKQKGWNGAQKKIDRLIRENAEARERAERAEARAKELEGKAAKPEPEKVAPVNAKPNQDDFKTLEEYFEALTDWKVDQKLRAQAEQAEAEAEKETVEQIVESYKERVNAARANHEDYDDVVDNAKTPWTERNLTKMEVAAADAFRTAVYEDENSGEILYYYASHPEELMALGELTPAGVVKAIARVSDKIVVPEKKEDEDEEETEEEIEVEEKPAKIVSKSAPPIRPINTGSTKSTVPLDKMSPRDYEKARDAGRVR